MTGLAEEVTERTWYHTIALPDGVVTRGFYDTLAAAKKVPLPESLAGKRCLDIGSCDGFWAFELERRGASEVVGLDLADPYQRDWPGLGPPDELPDVGRARDSFTVAKEALGSQVERVDLSVYEISPERLGEFDFVFIGNILLHLRDPIGALTAARSVVRGQLLSVDAISLRATLRNPRRPTADLSRRRTPYWWIPNWAGYIEYFTKAGYVVDDRGGPFFFRFGDGYHRRPPIGDLVKSPSLALFWTVLKPFGTTTAWILARPATGS